MPDGERIELPDGTGLFYVDEDHSYWRRKPDGSRGARLTGVTTVVKPLDFRPDNLMRWAARLNGEGIAELVSPALSAEPDTIPDALSWLCSAESIWEALVEAKLTYEHIRDRAAERGTNVHELALKALAEGKAIPNLAEFSQEERGYAQAVLAFWRDHDPQPTHVEQVVCDSELGVAGRFDLRCGFGSASSPGGVGVIDAKTGGYISEGAHAQVAGYRLLAERCGIGRTDWGLILKLNPDGTYELIDVEATAESFLLAVKTYREAARIAREARKARKAAQEAVPA
jgi:hypothetical protein